MCEVRSRKKRPRTKKKSTMVSSKKKWTVMNPIRRRMKKCKASSGQNGQLVHWWLLAHSGRSSWPTSSDAHGKFKPAAIKIGNVPWSSRKRNSPHCGSAPYSKFKPTIVKIGYVPWSSQNMKSQFTGNTWCTFLKMWDHMNSSSFNSLSLERQSQQTKKPCQSLRTILHHHHMRYVLWTHSNSSF
jgi:hypothetical protein